MIAGDEQVTADGSRLADPNLSFRNSQQNREMAAFGASELEGKVVIAEGEVHGFCQRCLEKAGSTPGHARDMADIMLAADTRGHYSHGLIRLEFYMTDLLTKNVASAGATPEVVKETSATALVDGHNMQGPVVGNFAMDLAIKKAKESGIGWVCVKRSNHIGIAGWYSMRAMEQGMLGMAFTNTPPMLVPTRARKQTLGTNPISVAAPGNNGDSMVLDMATTVVALGKVKVKKTVQEEVPLGWAVDKTGKPTTKPEEVLDGGGLMPLGGPEETSGYKGYGLALMVDVLCGVLSGAGYGPHVKNWLLHQGPPDAGQCFVAIDPSAFAPGFTDRMSDLMDHCRNLQPAEGESEVLVPGDPEKKHMDKCKSLGGIPYKTKQVEWADGIAKQHGLTPMTRLK